MSKSKRTLKKLKKEAKESKKKVFFLMNQGLEHIPRLVMHGSRRALEQGLLIDLVLNISIFIPQQVQVEKVSLS
jgi:hypothetical protein